MQIVYNLKNLLLKRTYRLVDGLETLYYNLIHSIRNLYLFGPVICRFRAWDAYYLLEVMEALTCEMSKLHIDGHLVRSNQTARELAVTSELCKRLREDKYFDSSDYKKAVIKRDRDKKRLARKFLKIDTWWD